jgi:integrase
VLSVMALKMLAYTWVRTKELRSMKWDHIDADGVWRVPGSVLGKTKKDHLVPLSKQALALLQQLRSLTGARESEYVFPATHRADRAMSDSTVLMLLYRLGYKGEMTGHGWRSVGSTWANELGYDDDAIERQLAHVEKDKVRAVYNRAQYLQARREILQAWGDWLDACLEQVDARGAQGGDAPALLLQREAHVGRGQLLAGHVAREGAAAAV